MGVERLAQTHHGSMQKEPVVRVSGDIPQTVERSSESFWYTRAFPRGDCTPTGKNSFFSLKATDINGNVRKFDEFSGKVLLVTNVASY